MSPLGVIFEAGSVCGLSIATERSPDLQKSIQTKQAHHLQNRNRNQTRVHLIVLFFFYSSPGSLKKKKKKTAAQVLSSRNAARGEQEGLS